VDAHRFEALVARARHAAGGGRFEAAVAAFDQALGLWRGDVLADLDGLATDWREPAAARWQQLRFAAIEDRVDARLALGHHHGVIGDLLALTCEHPYRERLWGQLMVALYRSGRQVDALATYQTARSVLVDQMGVEPGSALRAIERQVLAQAPDLAWPAPEVGGRPAPLPPVIATSSAAVLVGRTD